jgi:hypothetical protein
VVDDAIHGRVTPFTPAPAKERTPTP